MPTKHMMVSLSDQTLALIFGSLLGDGSLKLHPGYVNARFSFRHSSKQRAYFEWKAKLCGEISGRQSVFEQPADGFSSNTKLRYQSMALPALTELYDLTHDKRQFRIQRRWLNRMTSLSLAIWWLDDGSLISNSRRGVFCTDGFDEASVKLLARYLQVAWGIQTTVAPIHRVWKDKQYDQYRIWIRSSEELKKLLRIIAPHIEVKDMLYKVLVLYKDPILQQRWISELAALTSFSEAEISAEIDKRKQTLKAFQKKI
jgi:LAGLIDADG DNA endonuclease family protein